MRKKYSFLKRILMILGGTSIMFIACTTENIQFTLDVQKYAETEKQFETSSEIQIQMETVPRLLYLEFLKDRDIISIGNHYVAMVGDDGEVLTVYHPDWQEYYREVLDTKWKNAVKLMKSDDFPVAISAEGKLLVPNGQTPEDWQKKMDSAERPTVSEEEYPEYARNMVSWNGLYQVYRSYPSGAIGICEDGTIVETGLLGRGLTEEGLVEIRSWGKLKDMVVLYDGTEIAGLDEDGNVYGVGVEFASLDWKHIVSIESGDRMLFGLTEGGTVVHTEFGFGKEYSTEAMQDIVFIAAGYSHEEEIDVVYGITKEGKVVDRFGNELSGFVDVVEIDVSPMGETVVIGLKSDGTLCISKNADEAYKEAIEQWNQR